MLGNTPLWQSSHYFDLESIMLADLLPHRRSWFRECIDPFLLLLAQRRDARGTLVYNARLLAAFGDFAEKHYGRASCGFRCWLIPLSLPCAAGTNTAGSGGRG